MQNNNANISTLFTRERKYFIINEKEKIFQTKVTIFYAKFSRTFQCNTLQFKSFSLNKNNNNKGKEKHKHI